MIKKISMSTAIALLALPGVALAQDAGKSQDADQSKAAPHSTTQPTHSGTSAMPSSSSEMTSGGLRIADTATMALKFITVGPADMVSSNLVGTTIYNKQNENLGEVQDLVIQDGKTITGIVASVGGFLGLGESYVVLDPATAVINEANGTWRVMVDTNKDNLNSAPKFDYDKLRAERRR